MTNEKSAKGIKGYLLYSPLGDKHGRYFFRVYHKKGQFTDYDIRAEEIEVKLKSKYLSLYESDETKYLDWSSRALGKKS